MFPTIPNSFFGNTANNLSNDSFYKRVNNCKVWNKLIIYSLWIFKQKYSISVEGITWFKWVFLNGTLCKTEITKRKWNEWVLLLYKWLCQSFIYHCLTKDENTLKSYPLHLEQKLNYRNGFLTQSFNRWFYNVEL